MNFELLFRNIGSEFITPFLQLAEKQKNIRALIFDWDGVFNSGIKGEGISSPYYEADSMGINLLRFAFWLKFREIPLIAIISGENNCSAFHFARREHLQSVYFSMKNKMLAAEHINLTYGIGYDLMAFVFDDVTDLSLAEQCGLRFLIRRKASPVFTEYVKNKKLCDYISGNTGGENAVREISELLLYLSGEYNNVIDERIASGFNYKEYLSERDSITTSFLTVESGIITKKDIK
jgi:3-deoxy-D-manno-octulosonate 8-phosphate phosphatase (KDO 8-P phosphatase)